MAPRPTWEQRFGKSPSEMDEGEFKMAVLSSLGQLCDNFNDYKKTCEEREKELLQAIDSLDNRLTIAETKLHYVRIRDSNGDEVKARKPLREDTIIIVSKGKAIAVVGALIAGVVYFILKSIGICP